jgi:hypothetical protein
VPFHVIVGHRESWRAYTEGQCRERRKVAQKPTGGAGIRIAGETPCHRKEFVTTYDIAVTSQFTKYFNKGKKARP